ncbi:hypothetical protein BDV96DRAFT_662972 [Lophiotrema nucula]|uniref:BTB domain-containing protein n=1 Tax=Lophiotrema nucula TaxID=690887 RepID=A0A6A5ZUI7_9PLEO|nr:hypothetical protein BDV96DRAFT_662972 [Lophiotrema nucula]
MSRPGKVKPENAELAQVNDVVVSTHEAAALGLDAVEVRVGRDDEQKHFLVHKALLKSKSPFFAKALCGEWREAKDCAVNLPDVEPAIFELYVQFLFAQKLPIRSSPLEVTDEEIAKHQMNEGYNDDEAEGEKSEPNKDDDDEAEDSGNQEPVNSLSPEAQRDHDARMVLSEKFQDMKTRNALMKALVVICKEGYYDGSKYPDESCVNIIWEGTPRSSPMRQYLLDCYCDYSFNQWYPIKNKERFSHEFLFDIVRRMSQRRACPSGPSKTDDSSNYYEKPRKRAVDNLDESQDPKRVKTE